MKKSLKLVLITIIFIIILIINSTKVQAALQSNGSAPKTNSLSGWLSSIRYMQSLGGTLGRADTINTNDLSSNATDLDIHMQKNTEYGAMAILSASSYGNPNKIENGQTTTGNETGVVIKYNAEWVSAGIAGGFYDYGKPRYKNVYTSTYVAKNGDAVIETKGWHGSSAGLWIKSAGFGLLRSSNGIFHYDGEAEGNRGSYQASEWRPHYSRAAVVVGENL